MPGDDDSSLNRYERQLLDLQLERLGIRLNPTTKYIKVFNQDDKLVVTGTAEIMAPPEKLTLDRPELPPVTLGD